MHDPLFLQGISRRQMSVRSHPLHVALATSPGPQV